MHGSVRIIINLLIIRAAIAVLQTEHIPLISPRIPSKSNNEMEKSLINLASQIHDQVGNSSLNETQKNVGLSVTWECPSINRAGMECSCDFPHTLRCTGDKTSLQAISQHLKHKRPGMISLLDLTITGLPILPANFLEDVALHGLVVSSGELRKVHESAFKALKRPLQTLGLPNNLLDSVPTTALSHLTGLERLDLSHNKLKTLEADSFLGITNITYLDLCDNQLALVSPRALASLMGLRSLKLRGNRLSISALSAFRGLKNLEELDLSNNLLVGPLGPNLLPPMTKLRYLSVADNQLKNVQQGALMGLKNLTSLSLSRNQIDVLEDHAFRRLSTLTRLDLSHNRIVAVSSASLAHLQKLTYLDLTHNFLRSVTADLIIPLDNLENLLLDENDITMMSRDVPMAKLRLKHLSLADNPLNCDCNLLDFANWLANSTLEEEDKNSAVCATPPVLENGILTQVSPGSLLCGEPTQPATRPPLTGTQLTLKQFRFDERLGVDLLWHVDPCTEHYTCDTLLVYETIGESEIQTESTPLHCDSRMMRDPCSLAVTIPSSLRLITGHKYRYCVVLMVPSAYDDVSVGLGCSDVIDLKETKTNTSISNSMEKITNLRVNVSDEGSLRVQVAVFNPINKNDECDVVVEVFAPQDSIIHRRKLNCSAATWQFVGLVPGRYIVCASLDGAKKFDFSRGFVELGGRARCVQVQTFHRRNELFVLAVVAVICLVIGTTFFIGKSLIKKLKRPRIPPQYFTPAQEFQIATNKAHYIKLQATSKV